MDRGTWRAAVHRVTKNRIRLSEHKHTYLSHLRQDRIQKLGGPPLFSLFYNPLQYSCLENPMNREAWRAVVHGVAKSQTGLSN